MFNPILLVITKLLQEEKIRVGYKKKEEDWMEARNEGQSVIFSCRCRKHHVKHRGTKIEMS